MSIDLLDDSEDWPFIEVEKTFDWSLSMKEIQRIYGNSINPNVHELNRINKRRGVQSRWPVDEGPRIKLSKKINKIKKELGWPDKPKRPIEEFILKWHNEPEPKFHEMDNHFQEVLNLHKLLCSGRQ